MRFAAAHKWTTYMMVFSSYFAIATSGEMSDVVLLGALFLVFVSWWWEPPRIRYDRWSLPWTILSSLVLAYTVFMAFSGGDLIILGAEFLMYLLVAKLFNRRACKDYQHVYILTFLMLVAGTVLNSEFTYGVFFLGYVVSATWALILFHLRREMEDNFLLKHSTEDSSERVEVARILNSRRIVGRKFFIGTSMVSLTIFFAATLMFLMIPRIGFGLFFNKNRSGLTMAGFSDGVRLGGHGVIKSDSRIVMRVKVENEYEGRKAPYVHWRGVAFDRYSDSEWFRSRQAPESRRKITYPSAGKEHHHLLYGDWKVNNYDMLQRLERAMRHEVYLEPIGYDVMFGASMPMAYEFESQLGRRTPRKDRNDEIRFTHTAGLKYVVYSDLDPPSPNILRAAPNRLPDGYEVYLQIPEEIPDRVRELAEEITAGAKTNYDKARLIEQWLKNTLGYTLEMKSPGTQEPIDFFLFSRRKGHCEYFSSAMAIMARAVGVPTRNVNGFLGGEWNEYDSYIAVRAGDAHSWVEVYFHDIGWVTFDPTPSAEVDRLGRGGDGIRARFRRFVDTLRFKWFKWVIEYDLYRQLSLFKDLRNMFSGGTKKVKSKLAGAKDWMKARKVVLGAIAGGVFTILVLIVLWRRKRRDESGTVGGRRRRGPRRRVAALYNGVLTRLAKRGYKRNPATTPREHATRLEALDAPGARELQKLTELYYASEYSGTADTDADYERAVQLRDRIAAAIAAAKKRKSGISGAK